MADRGTDATAAAAAVCAVYLSSLRGSLLGLLTREIFNRVIYKCRLRHPRATRSIPSSPLFAALRGRPQDLLLLVS